MTKELKTAVAAITVIALGLSSYLIVGFQGKTPDGCEEVIVTCEVLADQKAADDIKTAGETKARKGYQTLRLKALRCDQIGADAVVKLSPRADGGELELSDPQNCKVETCALGKCAETLEVKGDLCAFRGNAGDNCWRIDRATDGGVIYRNPGVGNVYPKSRLDGGECTDSPCARIFGKEKE